MQKIYILVTALISFSSYSGSPLFDDLYLGKSTVSIQELPLEQYIPLMEVTKLIDVQVCTASPRGFKSSWALYEEKLFLMAIYQNPCHGKNELVPSSLFPKQYDYPIEAKWYTGDLTVQLGEEEVRNNKLVYEAIVFSFRQGKLLNKKLKMVEMN